MPGISILIVGLCLIAFGCIDWLHFYIVFRQGNKTEAVVIKFYGGDPTGNWYPVLRYTVNGVEYTKKVRYSSSNSNNTSEQDCESGDKYYLGKRLTIFYDTRRPSYVIVEGEGTIRCKVYVGIGVAVLALFAYVVTSN